MFSKYTVSKFAGKVYCGNAFFNTLDECYEFANDGFCDKMKVYDGKTGDLLMTVKINTQKEV